MAQTQHTHTHTPVMAAAAATARQTALTCNGHTRPVVDLDFNADGADGTFLLSSAKGTHPALAHPRAPPRASRVVIPARARVIIAPPRAAAPPPNAPTAGMALCGTAILARRRQPSAPWMAPLCWATRCRSSLQTRMQVGGVAGGLCPFEVPLG